MCTGAGGEDCDQDVLPFELLLVLEAFKSEDCLRLNCFVQVARFFQLVKTGGRSLGISIRGGQVDLADEVVAGRGGRQRREDLVLELLRLENFL